MSATGNKHDCYYTASMNYKSFQDIALLAVKDLKRSQTPHENYAICSHFVRDAITAVLNMYVNASSNEMVHLLCIVTHKGYKTVMIDYYVEKDRHCASSKCSELMNTDCFSQEF
jgi:hypothetical protein